MRYDHIGTSIPKNSSEDEGGGVVKVASMIDCACSCPLFGAGFRMTVLDPFATHGSNVELGRDAGYDAVLYNSTSCGIMAPAATYCENAQLMLAMSDEDEDPMEMGG